MYPTIYARSVLSSKTETMVAIPGTINHLCGTCRHIFNKVQDLGCHEGLVYHETLESLISSAKSACGICTTLLDEVNARTAEHTHLPSSDWLFPIKCECDTSGASWQTSFDMTFSLASFGRLKFTFEAIQNHSGRFPLDCGSQPLRRADTWQRLTLPDKKHRLASDLGVDS